MAHANACLEWKQFIPELIKLHREGNFPIDKLCKVYSVKDFEQAVSDLRTGKVSAPNSVSGRLQADLLTPVSTD